MTVSSDDRFMPPEYVSPAWNEHLSPRVALLPDGASSDLSLVGNGLKLYPNSQGDGYTLLEDPDGFGPADVENNVVGLSQGGGVLLNQRVAHGEMFLPIAIMSPDPADQLRMLSDLARFVYPQSREPHFFEVAVLDRHTGETRFRRAVYKAGLSEDWWSEGVPGRMMKIGLTVEFVDPYWYGAEREIRRTLGQLDKKFITASEGFEPSTSTEADGTTREIPGLGPYEIPHFPIFISGSVVNSEYLLDVAGDVPAWWTAKVTGPGTDFTLENGEGQKFWIPGEIRDPIIIRTEPTVQDVTLEDGTPIWERVDTKHDDMFPLEPGRNTIKILMVGATLESEIRFTYRERFLSPMGGGRS